MVVKSLKLIQFRSVFSEPPELIGLKCEYKVLHIQNTRPATLTSPLATTNVLWSAHLRAYYDQSLFLDGVRSFEHIYHRGKLEDVEFAIHGME